MRTIGLILVLALALGLGTYALLQRGRSDSQPPPQPAPGSGIAVEAGEAQRQPVSLPEADPAERTLRRMDEVLSRLERLETALGELRNEVSLRLGERTRVPAPAYARSAAARLDDDDLIAVRTLIHDALTNEAWMRRQVELVEVALHLAHQLPIE